MSTIGCHECAWGKVAGCWRCGSRAEPIPELLAASNVSPESKAALSEPHAFLKARHKAFLVDLNIKQDRRKYLPQPECVTGFDLEIAA